MTAKQLSERETAALKAIEQCHPRGAVGIDLVRIMRELLGSISPLGVTPAGIHRTAASLCRKNLAWRSGTSKQQSYKITQPGRDALRGSQGGQWIARKAGQ